ncbi:hypothetical protein SEA_ITZA_73 [Streptomyces phage Itza]|nr:hypothetical protein SEA_URZA_72 [Streptomyces phage Urza]QJD50638.1 hypothetical protein SEA_ITZA_73 [Streptomyces phage Itza]
MLIDIARKGDGFYRSLHFASVPREGDKVVIMESRRGYYGHYQTERVEYEVTEVTHYPSENEDEPQVGIVVREA